MAGKKKPYALVSQEEGRGPKTTSRYATLGELAAAVKEQWQGTEYIDGPDGFHTDYSRFTLVGAKLSDLGGYGPADDDGWREFRFNPALLADAPAETPNES